MLKKLSQFIEHSDPSLPKSGASKNAMGNLAEQKKQKISDSFDFLNLIRMWKSIAGDKLSEHTIPLKNQNGTLLILSNHSAFANELSYMELPLKKKIFTQFPELEKNIKNIKFIVDSTHFQEKYDSFIAPIEKKKQNELHPFSPEFKRLKKEAEQQFSEIKDLEIKEKMISLFIQTQANS